MSSINGLGQGIFNYYRKGKSTGTLDASAVRSAADSDADSNTDSEDQPNKRETEDAFGKALRFTLHQHGIDADQFLQEFLGAMRTLTSAQTGTVQPVMQHFNAVG
jgi:hypothetical protein